MESRGESESLLHVWTTRIYTASKASTDVVQYQTRATSYLAKSEVRWWCCEKMPAQMPTSHESCFTTNSNPSQLQALSSPPLINKTDSLKHAIRPYTRSLLSLLCVKLPLYSMFRSTSLLSYMALVYHLRRYTNPLCITTWSVDRTVWY